MSTIQDFENAPVGATATAPNGNIALKTERRVFEWSLYDPRGNRCDVLRSDEMEHFTLNPTAPTTAQEAFDLTWELAHPVKEGQVIPKGTKWMKKVGGNIREYTMTRDYTVTANDTFILRTHEPLPETEPGWLDAPAVLAAMDDCSWQKVWLPSTPGYWECTCCGVVRHWSKMNDVTPLWPEEDKGGMYITGPGSIQIKDRNGQTVWEI